MELSGKVAVVTGGAAGIGQALCRRFAHEAAAVVVVSDVDEERGLETAADVGGIFVRCDVSHESEVQQLTRRVLEQFGRIDLFVSNAGITAPGGVEVPDERWQQLWQVNLMAHVYAARAVVPQMLTQGSGWLLQVSSAAGVLTEIGSASYSVTKHAAVALAEWLSIRYRRQGIGVSCLCPAGVMTDFLNLDDPVHQFLHLSAVSPEHVADCVIEGLLEERFLILTHEQVEEFFRYRTEDYDRWLHNFSRIHEKLERAKDRRSPAVTQEPPP
jgi:NAD(P)-dependent dehydrogenase (short-subunit alcohol dehydrogenase family)